MELLKNLRIAFWVTTIGWLTATTWAGPPVDLTNPDALEPRKPLRPRLNESDIVYVDNSRRTNEEDSFTRVLFDVPGRSAPGRGGKVLFKMRMGDAVKTLKLSKDSRWWAVQDVRTSRRAWVPRNAVRERETGKEKAPESK